MNSITLLCSYQSSVSTIVGQMKQKGKLEDVKVIFSKKNSARIEHSCQIKLIALASFCHVTFNRFFPLGLRWLYFLKSAIINLSWQDKTGYQLKTWCIPKVSHIEPNKRNKSWWVILDYRNLVEIISSDELSGTAAQWLLK